MHSSRIGRLVLAAVVAVAAACQAPRGGAGSSGDASGGDYDAVQRQVARGAAAFADRCARCHGSGARGTDRAPALAGSGTLSLRPRAGAYRERPFATALDVAEFAAESMPPDGDPVGRSTAFEVVAFLLDLRGVKLDRPIDASTAGEVLLHR